MSRRLAREDCFKLMFEYEFLKERNEISLSTYLNEGKISPDEKIEGELTEEEKQFVKNEYDGLIAKDSELENIITKYLKGYTLQRLYKIDLAILKIAVYEMLFSNDKTTSGGVINEAVELAKKYSTDKSYSFVNGVLASVLKGEQNDATTTD